MKNIEQKNTGNENSFSKERQDVTQVRDERSCPQLSGSPRFISRDLSRDITESIVNISNHLIIENYRKDNGDDFRMECDDETLVELNDILNQLRKYSLPYKFTLDQLDGYSE